MRDGATRRRTMPHPATWALERAQVDHWRRMERPQVLHTLAVHTRGLAWSRPLLRALLDELHIGDDFDALVGATRRLPANRYPQLLAMALLLRHSWCPGDLSRTARRLGLSLAATTRTPTSLRTHTTPTIADTAIVASHADRPKGRGRTHR